MHNVIWGICEQPRPISSFATAQSDQGLCCPQTELLDTIERFNREQMPGEDFAHMQDDVNRHIWRMLKRMLSFDAALVTCV